MPKYGIHHIVLKEAIPKLYGSGDAYALSAAKLLSDETLLPSAVIGSIGPDIFFWGPDYDYVKLYVIYDRIKEEVIRLYNEIMSPIWEIRDAVKEPVDALVNTLAPTTVALIENLLAKIKETAEVFITTISTGLFAGLLEGANLLTDAANTYSLAHEFFQGMYVPGVQTNEKEEDWYWFDMLHYRKTGDFARNLVREAVSDRQKAFAFGYLSHIATDVTGHGYVNQIVGTVYRLNVHRHVTAENFQDTWAYARYYSGESINQSLLSRLKVPETLPEDVGDLIYNTFKNTYAASPHPLRLEGDGFYTRDQIDETYNVFYDVLKLLEGQSVKPPEEPFSGAADILAKALDKFSAPPSPPKPPSSKCSWDEVLTFWKPKSRKCYNEFFKDLTNWLNYLGELLSWSVAALNNLIDLVTALLASLPITVLLAILYGIQLLCYQIYRSARWILAINGFVFPEPDELDNSIGANLITLYGACTAGIEQLATPPVPSEINIEGLQILGAVDMPPLNKFPSSGRPFLSNLVCPVPDIEEPATAAAFYRPGIYSTPESFIKEDLFYDPYQDDSNEAPLKLYALAQTPDEVRTNLKEGQRFPQKNIGNAVSFTAWLIQNASKPYESLDRTLQGILYTNWNLDSDRGYGYHSWKGRVPQVRPFKVENEEWI